MLSFFRLAVIILLILTGLNVWSRLVFFFASRYKRICFVVRVDVDEGGSSACDDVVAWSSNSRGGSGYSLVHCIELANSFLHFTSTRTKESVVSINVS